MRCPKCRTETLDPFGVIEGVHVDFCSECKGIWFDEGELAFYTEMPDDVPDLEKALRHGQSTDQTCPRCGDQQLVELYYIPGRPPLLDVCPKCRGVFVDKGELPKSSNCRPRPDLQESSDSSPSTSRKAGAKSTPSGPQSPNDPPQNPESPAHVNIETPNHWLKVLSVLPKPLLAPISKFVGKVTPCPLPWTCRTPPPSHVFCLGPAGAGPRWHSWSRQRPFPYPVVFAWCCTTGPIQALKTVAFRVTSTLPPAETGQLAMTPSIPSSTLVCQSTPQSTLSPAFDASVDPVVDTGLPVDASVDASVDSEPVFDSAVDSEPTVDATVDSAPADSGVPPCDPSLDRRQRWVDRLQ